jgi:SRSO17 transposase
MENGEDGPMDPVSFDRVAEQFGEFHARFAPLFGRKEARQRSEQYLRGLLVQDQERRNAENLAEAIDGASPRALQRFLTEAPWKPAPVIDQLHAYVGERLATPRGVLIVDDSGVAKQGKHSVGVARQYSGSLGKVGNCQIGVFLAYASERGHALVDQRLYLPRAWIDDPARCRAAGVPEQIPYQSKAEQALEMIQASRQRGFLPAQWVTADAGFGAIPSFRASLDAAGWWYVLEVPKTTPLVARQPGVSPPPFTPGQRCRARPDLDLPPTTIEILALGLRRSDWQELTVAEGAQGPRSYQFAARRVHEFNNQVLGRESWALFRRNLDGSELKYYLSNASSTLSLATLAWVTACRWSIETEFKTEKGHTGLDEYEVRRWNGWHHHLTLALLAGAFLMGLEQEWGGKSAAGDAPPARPGPPGAAAAAQLDPAGPPGLAEANPTPQPARQTFACPTPVARVA